MYNLAHSTQGAMLFIFSAIPAVPSLGKSERANHWLRKFIYIGVFVPIYLFSGISKFRYLGIIPNLSGSWLWVVFRKGSLDRALFKKLFTCIGNHHSLMLIFSWGNIFIEMILPVLLMLFNEIEMVQLMFHFIEILFHLTIFVLLGPNFLRYCLMHLYALDILRYIPCFATKRRGVSTVVTTKYLPKATHMDRARAIYSVAIVLGWWYSQFTSDWLHISGQQSWTKRINSYWPFPELSMFAKPRDSPNAYVGLFLTILSFAVLLATMLGKWTSRQHPRAIDSIGV